jgi:hypothetical protein
MRKMKLSFTKLPNPSQFDWVNLEEEMYLVKRHCGNSFLFSSSYEMKDLGKEKYKYGGKKGCVLWKEWMDKIPDNDMKEIYKETLCETYNEVSPTSYHFYRIFVDKEYTEKEKKCQQTFDENLIYEGKE